MRFRKDKNLWVGEITLPAGKRRTKYAKTQREVREWIDEQKHLLREGLITVNNKITISAFLKRWFDEVARHQLRASTLITHESIMRRHIYPEVGEVQLGDLSPAHLQALYSKKLDSGLSKRTVRYIHTILHQALNQAMKWGLVARNVSDAVESPVPDKHEIDPLTVEQIVRLVEALQGDRLYPYYLLLLSTGLRRGEALALTTDCLLLDKGLVMVKKTLVYLVRRGLVLGEPKSKRSRRVVALPEVTREVLRHHLANREVESPYVFCTSKGTPFGPRNVMRHFKKVLRKAGLPITTRLHDLRHTFVSILLAENVPPSDVQKIVGHASFSTTVDIYGHLMGGAQREAARKMDEVLWHRVGNVRPSPPAEAGESPPADPHPGENAREGPGSAS